MIDKIRALAEYYFWKSDWSVYQDDYEDGFITAYKLSWNAAIETACNELQQFVHKDHTVADIEKTLLKLKITK